MLYLPSENEHLRHDRPGNANLVIMKIDVVPLQSEECAHPQAGADI
jgi:hypothetical protein